jgi:hypothetical protein
MRVRAHVKLVAALWLTCQVAAFAAAPAVLCHDHGVMAGMADDHECDRMCPMHHHGQPASTPAPSHDHQHHHGAPEATTTAPAPGGASLDCRCPISDAALAGIIHESGIVPGAFTVLSSGISARAVSPDRVTPTRPQHPDTPPPRA